MRYRNKTRSVFSQDCLLLKVNKQYSLQSLRVYKDDLDGIDG